MKAFFIKQYGKRSGSIGELPEPKVGANDVLVQIKATSINPLDAKIRSGEFKQVLPYTFPLILGNDLAGVVVRVGPGVRQFKPGDEVYARPAQDRIGTFAELISVDQDSLALKPRNISMEQAASLPLVALTAWQVLVETAQLKKGQKVLIQAGSGGVGSVAIQLARHLGAFVATTTSTSNVEWVKALGADIVIDYKKQDFETALNDYDVVVNSLDPVVLKKSVNCLKPGGLLVSISGPPTPEFGDAQGLSWPIKQILRLLSFRIRKISHAAGVKYSFVFMRANGAQLKEITSLVESGAIKPVIDKVYPFTSIADALTYVEQGRVKGKVVINLA